MCSSDLSISLDFDAAGFSGGCSSSDFVPPEFLDGDEDGYRPYDGDCDDEDGWVYPTAVEMCDGVDNNCDGQIDEACDDIDALDTGLTSKEDCGGCASAAPASTGSAGLWVFEAAGGGRGAVVKCMRRARHTEKW